MATGPVIPPLPPGFVADASGAPPLPPGFELDGAAKPSETGMLQKLASGIESYGESAKNVAMGGLKGASDIGATFMMPVDYISDKITGKRNPTITDLVTGNKPKTSNEERREGLKSFFKENADTDSLSFKGGELAADIAGTAGAGGFLAKGVLKTAKHVPALASIAPKLAAALESGGFSLGNAPKALTRAGKAGDALIRAAGGAATGAASVGLVDPSSTETGAVVGAVLPTAVRAAGAAGKSALGGVRALVDPLYDAGQKKILGRLLNRVSGDDAVAVEERLRQAGMPFVGPTPAGEVARNTMGEIVPGSLPTVGQAARNGGVASLERTASAIEPNAQNAMAERLAEQNAARIAQVEKVAGDVGEREFHAAARQTAADELYQSAYKAGMDLRRDAATGAFLSKSAQSARKGEITKLMDTPAMKEAAQEARNLMANDPNLKGQLLNPAGSVQGLDYTRRALSDLIDGASGNKQRILINLRDRLDTTLNKISPKYAEARATFAEMSKPINQMDTGAQLLEKGVNKVTGKLEPGKFINNLTDKTAANATGFRKATLEGTLDAGQNVRLDNVAEDLRRAVAAQNAGGGPGSDSVKKLAYSNFIDAAGVPTFLRNMGPLQVAGNVAARGADVLYGRANREMATKLAEMMGNPAYAAEAMKLAQTPQGVRALKAISGSPALQSLMLNSGAPNQGSEILRSLLYSQGTNRGNP